MMINDSTGGTSLGSGNPPVFDFQSMLVWVANTGFRLHDSALTRELYESKGFQRLAPYFEYLVGKDIPAKLRTIETIADLYEFDSDLRFLLLKGIEVIEVQLKSQYARLMLQEYGPYCLYDCSFFRNEKDRQSAVRTVEIEARRQMNNYAGIRRAMLSDEARIPVWSAIDVASLGVVRRLYSNTKSAEITHRVAQSFDVNHRCLHSWLRTIALVRNCCAHFNPYVVRPQIPAVPKPVYDVEADNASPLYAIVLVRRLLEGRATVYGELAEGEARSFVAEAERIVGEFTWRHPDLAVALRIPYDFADAYAAQRLPNARRQDRAPELRYRIVELAA